MTRRLQLLIGLIAILTVCLSGAVVIDTAVIVHLSNRQTLNQQGDTAALCALRTDLRERVDSGVKFLRSHPTGIPGIPAATIRAGLTNAQRTEMALRPVRCPEHK